MSGHDGKRVPGPLVADRDRPMASACSFEDFFRVQNHRIAKLLLSTVSVSLAEAQDVVQEALTIMFRRWDEFRNNPAAGAYLAKVALNLAKRNAVKARWEAPTADVTDLADVLALAADSSGEAEQGQLVIRLLRQLPPAQAETMACVVDGLKPSEISQLLSVPPSTVRSNLRHARKRLAAVLREAENDVGS